MRNKQFSKRGEGTSSGRSLSTNRTSREERNSNKSFRKTNSSEDKFFSTKEESKKRIGKSLPKTTPTKTFDARKKRPYDKFKNEDSTCSIDVKPQRKCVLIKKKPAHPDDGKMRLNRYLANSGICSRREADEYIAAGVVRVNDVVVTELGVKVANTDKVYFHEQLVRPEKKTYLLLNKPKNCVTTSDDPQARLTVMDLVKNATPERVYPVGRLDRNTTGVLLMTNDGDLATKLTHPKHNKKKIYHVGLDKSLTREHFDTLKNGVELEDGFIQVDDIQYLESKNDEIGVEIHSGRNRIVRRLFESLGYKVIKLDRVYFAGLTKKNLSRGKWRFLTQMEINMLKMGSYE